MKLLVYRWGSLSEPLFCETLKLLEVEYIELAREMKNYHYDTAFAQEMIELLHKEKIGQVFSYDYFPLIAMLCEINRIPYISWIYDCPQYTLQSKTLGSPYNYIFCFDKAYTKRLQEMGALHCEHYPLGIDRKLLEKAKQKMYKQDREYVSDVSFIGSLYNEARNRYRHADLTEYVKGWTEGVIEAQLLVYGYNFVKEVLMKQPEVVKELKEKCKLQLGEEFLQDDLQLVTDTLGVEISAREREHVLAQISDFAGVKLYTSSKVPESLKKANLEVGEPVDYETELPLIYANSKINLNITSKTIETGIPQRIFDILGCGGFCLTNYQSEIVEYFEEGREIAVYYNLSDLVTKVVYYLEHEEERRQIAENGRKKVWECFGLEFRVCGMLDMVKRMQEYGDAKKVCEQIRKLEELKTYVNNCLRLEKVQEMVEALRENRNVVKEDNDLSNMYYLAVVYEREQQKGNTTVYKGSMQETLDYFYELQRRVRRLEWWEEYDPQEVYLYMIEKDLSVYELQWAIETVCVDKAKVWGLLNEK